MSPMSNRSMWSPFAWPAHAVESAPLPVRDAHQTMMKSADRATEARQAHRTAVTQLQDADRDDHAAARVAISEGKPVPASVKPEREQAVTEADRYRRACEALAVADEEQLFVVAAEHRDQWLADIVPTVEQGAEHATIALDNAETALQQLADLSSVWGWLRHGDVRVRLSGQIPLGAREAMREARLAALRLTPVVIQQEREERARAEAAEARTAPRSFAGIVLDAAGRRALSG